MPEQSLSNTYLLPKAQHCFLVLRNTRRLIYSMNLKKKKVVLLCLSWAENMSIMSIKFFTVLHMSVNDCRNAYHWFGGYKWILTKRQICKYKIRECWAFTVFSNAVTTTVQSGLMKTQLFQTEYEMLAPHPK